MNTHVIEAYAMRAMRQALSLINPSPLAFWFNAKEFIKQEGNHCRLHHKT
ncbi:hypothetical protein [Coxiella-like endosymbiont of Rhipicephalus sanguineus]|nr:hypothetical protein [Coxiella-like endosymbiont of Rhipicephalus sanguineus]